MIITDGVHLISDSSIEELHDFAINKLGMKREWFQFMTRYPHYDLMGVMKKKALRVGAKLVTGQELVKALHEAPYLMDFWQQSIKEVENDISIFIKLKNLSCKVEDVKFGGQFGMISFGGIQVDMKNMFLKKYYKEYGFYRAIIEKENKKKVIQKKQEKME